MMNDKQKNILIPKLRFPEFKDSGEWEEKKLGEITVITTGTSNREDSTENKGKYTFFDRSEDIRTSDKFLFDTEAIIVGGEGQKFIPKYFIGKFDLHQRAYAIMNFKDNNFGKYLYYYIYQNRGYFLRYAVGSTVKSLRLPIFEKMPILIPQPAEQQKIASCLSSLDELLEAHKQKLELLKAHKKGLMQNLFPQEGEKVPKLRFPEFKDSGEWKEKKLGEVAEILKGGTPNTSIEKYWNGEINWITPAEMSDIKFVYSTNRKISKLGLDKSSAKLLPKNSIILSTRAPIGHLIINKKEMAFNQGCKGLIPKNDINYEFLYYNLFNCKTELNNLGAGNTFKELSSKNLSNFKIKIPQPVEQQKIAECLSSVDELITAEAEKIEQLEKHKKGLMQGLFPVADKNV